MTSRAEYSERVPFDPMGTQFIIMETFMIDGWCIYDQDDNPLFEGTLDRQCSVMTGDVYMLRLFPEGMPGLGVHFLDRAAYVRIKKTWDHGGRVSPRRKRRITKHQVDWSKNGF